MSSLGGRVVDARSHTRRQSGVVTQVAAARLVCRPSVPSLRRAKRLKLNFYPEEFHLLSTQTWITDGGNPTGHTGDSLRVFQSIRTFVGARRQKETRPMIVIYKSPLRCGRVHNSPAGAELTTLLI